ncbi:MAG: maltose acetyltransferase [Solirubrobacterales bacterium]|nr:maltose acetyltransferase [Solirubrobacterales bacterium]
MTTDRPARKFALSSAEHRTSLAARGRAEVMLRLCRARGQELQMTGRPYFYEGWPIIRAEGPILLGEECRLRGGPVRSRFVARSSGRIEIGAHAGFNFGAEVYSELGITIGDYSSIGPFVTIYDTSFHPVDEGGKVHAAPVEIGENVWIGRQVLILPGVTIGEHSVVASGAIVTRDIPPRTLVAGNPARPLREVKASDGWRRM